MPDGGASIWLPMIIGAGVSTAGSVYAANAAGNAAQTQTQYGQQALALERQMYNDAVTRTTPFVNNGTNANNALAKLMGLGTGGPLGGTPNTPTMPNGLPPGAMTEAPPVVDVRTMNADSAAWNPLDTLMSGGTPSNTLTPSTPSGPFGASAPTVPNTLTPAGSGMVTMISPDGQERQAVPQSQVAFFQRRGATIAPGPAAS